MATLKQDTGKFRTNTKDQFYTNKEVAKKCIEEIKEKIQEHRGLVWLEPSAGSGSFYNNTPEGVCKKGMDIDPRCEGIEKNDFLLNWVPDKETRYLVFGNPPFGRQSSTAKSFIRKSCKFADAIAFILPKSFTKPSMNNAFDHYFHIIHQSDTGKDAFELNGKKYDVPCVFQIWRKKSYKRDIEKKEVPSGFTYVKEEDGYDFALRRVGAHAGTAYVVNTKEFSKQSHYFIKLTTRNIEAIIAKINQHEFPSNTVGPRSLSKNEITTVLNNIIVSHSSS